MRIAVIISMIEEACQSQIWEGLNHQATQQGIDLLTYVAGTSDGLRTCNHFDVIKAHLETYHFDGIIIFTGALTEHATLDQLIELLTDSNLPLVSIAGHMPQATSVLIDNSTGIFNLIKHLSVDHNRQHIAFIRGPESNGEAEDRFLAYKKALSVCGLEYNPALVQPGDFSEQSGAIAVQQLLQQKVPFDAILAADDFTAIGALTILQEEHIRVPADVSLVGFDDIPEATMMTPSLSTLKQPFFELGITAIKEIQVAQSSIEKVELLSTKAIYRDSCGCLPEAIQRYRSNTIKSHIFAGETIDIKQYLELIAPLITQQVLQVEPAKQKEYRTFINSAISEIWSTYPTAITSIENRDLFMNQLSLFLSRSKTFCTDLSLWKFILTREISFNDSSQQVDALHYLQQEARIILDEHSAKAERFLMYQKQNAFLEIRESCQRLIAQQASSDLYTIVTEELLNLGIKEAELVLFNRYSPMPYSDWTMPEHSIAQIIICDGKEIEITYEDQSFRSSKGGHPSFLSHSRAKSHIFLPLYTNDEYFGYLLTETSTTAPYEIYEEFRVTLSAALKSCHMMDNLRALSMADGLTGLSNRRGFMLLAQQLFNASLARKQELIIFYFDMDFLKKINDSMGHKAGDQALQAVATILKRTFRGNDIVGRLGGDEFTAIIEYTTKNLETIILDRLENFIKIYNEDGVLASPLSLSVGFAHLKAYEGETLQGALEQADAKMMEHKKLRNIQR